MADAVAVTRGGRVTIVVAGAVLSTVTAIAAVVATLPALSVARASSAYDPSAGCALHETVFGAAVALPKNFPLAHVTLMTEICRYPSVPSAMASDHAAVDA